MSVTSPFPYTFKEDRPPIGMAFVYVLVNPIDKKVFYIGSTKGSINQTFKRHISKRGERGCNVAKRMVVRQIAKKGLLPLIEVVKTCPVAKQFRAEVEYMRRMRRPRKLTNMVGKYR